MNIEKNIHQLWIGPKPAPVKWMKTWQSKNPDWNYILWDNKKVFSRDWINHEMMTFYAHRNGWHGVADIIRYEILHEYGGFMPGADSECLHPIDELFENDHELFAVRCRGDIKDWARVDRKPITEVPVFLRDRDDVAIAPIYASKKGNDFMMKLIEGLKDKTDNKVKLGPPWKTTGNVYCSEMVKKHNPKIMIWPMHYFIPYHPVTAEAKNPYEYIGNGKIYAKHFWGTTRRCYNEGRE
ncbi:MAG: glycosyltransferase [Patescibacteria group bacterium]|jgi:mannosyltransferase OCH1-like enzyme|nr:glycosyltransferase [Patescibacteria group bacterium]